MVDCTCLENKSPFTRTVSSNLTSSAKNILVTRDTISPMEENHLEQTLSWQAPEYEQQKRSKEWFLTLWIITIAATIATFILKNFTFGIFLILAAGVLTILAKRPPRSLEASINHEALRFGPNRYYFDQIEAFSVERIDEHQGRILLKLKHSFMPLITIPLTTIEPQKVDSVLATYIPRKNLEESLLEKIIHYFGI